MAKRGRPRVDKKKKRQRVKVQFIERIHTGKVTEPYAIAEKIIAAERADLKDVKVGFAWNTGWRADADGRLQIGKCSKRKDLDRELDEYDYIIQLNKDAWQTMSAEHKERWIFHELEHAQIATDSNGEPKKNDRGRFVCRIKKHDIEEFRSVIDKYGLGEDLSAIAQAAIADAQRPLLNECEKKAAEKGMAAAVAVEEAEHEKESQKAKGKRKNKKPQRTVNDIRTSPRGA